MIHKTAIIDPGAHLAGGVEIGPYTVIENNVTIHSGTTIAAHACIRAGTEIGEGCRIHAGCILGDVPQDIAFDNKPTFLRIGQRNIFREHVTVHRGTKEGSCTTIANDNYIMTCAHIGHNCDVGSNNIIVSGALLAGYVTIEDEVFVAGNAGIHQFVRVGRLAMIGGNSRATRDVPPFMLLKGDGYIWALNSVGLKRSGISAATRSDLKQAFKILYRSGLSVPGALRQLATLPPSPEMAHLIDFIRNSRRGIASGARGQKQEVPVAGEDVHGG